MDIRLGRLLLRTVNGKNEIEVTTTQEVNRMDITLTNKGLDAVLRSRMDEK